MPSKRKQAKKFISDLRECELIHDCTNEEKLVNSLSTGKKIYLGIDPTAPSLHIGNYLSLSLLKRAENAGFQTVVLIGGLTASIGDPSFKSADRKALSQEEISVNVKNITKQIRKICSKCEILNNWDFYRDLKISNVLSEIFSFINVAPILSKDFLKDKLENGLTVTEFLYPSFQSHDFYYLYKNHNVGIQLGGSDQWGNITTGLDYIKKKLNNVEADAVGVTIPLLLDGNNKKFGKSENNAFFLDPKLTKPFALFQYLINLSDDLSCKFLKFFSFKKMSTINNIINKHQEAPWKKHVQKKLALELIGEIHSSDIANHMLKVSEKLFSSNSELTKEDFEAIEGIIPTITNSGNKSGTCRVVDLLVQSELVSSLTQAWNLIPQKGIYCFDELIQDYQHTLNTRDAKHGYFLLRKGKKDFALVKVK